MIGIEKLEKFQRLAARFIYKSFKGRASPASTLETANLEPITDRRKIARLNLFSQLYYREQGIQPRDYVIKDISGISRLKHS